GIEMNVIDESGQRRILLHEDRLITSLKHVPALVVEPVKSGGECALQPLHSRDQIGFGRLDGEVVVVAHQDRRVELPSGTRGGLEKTCYERVRGLCVGEKIAPVVAPVEHMVNGSREFDSGFSRHLNEGDTATRV